ncbi:glycerol-3-phosphate dehydrogenase [Arhodomonas sp. AD133]|uniref:glycerol-3-phosphate dehydrogenase n=1 Tax=Arhodomonas sp. AD133 TaxID=3415009 RepID=UPI003EB7D793
MSAADHQTNAAAPLFDMVVIGAGVNGAGIARDAAGRGLSVLLCDKEDLAYGTSSRSGKLVHGGLRYLEYYEFRLVREALKEREVLLENAPHIIWPMRFVLPHNADLRPAWMIRAGLFLYDHLGGRRRLPGSRGLDLTACPEGKPLQSGYHKGFEYSDCWVDDSRLVVFNAMDARRYGAEVYPRTSCEHARRDDGEWLVTLREAGTGFRRDVRARALVNAAGPWVDRVLQGALEQGGGDRVRLVKGSHIVVPKPYVGEQAYLLQNSDKRVIFVNPYEGDKLLIGTTDIVYEGDPDEVSIDREEVEYLCGVVSRYFHTPITPDDVVSAFSGIRPLFDDRAENPSAVTRDYVFDIADDGGRAPLLSVFGGKITTYRRLAEHAMERLKPYFPDLGEAWTGARHLPGGDIADADFDTYFEGLEQCFPWVPASMLRRLARAYGTITERLLAGAGSLADLGRHFGADLYERELRYLIDDEWAANADDVAWRRTKLGLRLSDEELAAIDAWIADEYGLTVARSSAGER